MLCLHIGMPKTGTTALQGFLRANQAHLDDMGLRYLEAGRKRPDGQGNVTISHNRLLFDLNRQPDAVGMYRDDIAKEYADHKDKVCLISSEALYSADHAELAKILDGVPQKDMRIVFYCRRYSDYFEAEYKQRAKNSRLGGDGLSFIRTRLAAIKEDPDRYNYSGQVKRLRAAYPDATIEPHLYNRAGLKNENVVEDFFDRLDLQMPPAATLDRTSNPSLSRVASEAFGIITRAIGRKDSRRLRRSVPNDPVMFRKNDVLEPNERTWMDETLSQTDEDFRREFFADSKTLFPPVQLSDADKTFRRGSEQELADFQRASEIVFNMALKKAASS